MVHSLWQSSDCASALVHCALLNKVSLTSMLHTHTYIHTYIHACIHTYIHTYIKQFVKRTNRQYSVTNSANHLTAVNFEIKFSQIVRSTCLQPYLKKQRQILCCENNKCEIKKLIYIYMELLPFFITTFLADKIKVRNVAGNIE